MFISKSSVVISFPKPVSTRDTEATMVAAIIFKIPHGAWPIQDTEDSYVHATAMVSEENFRKNFKIKQGHLKKKHEQVFSDDEKFRDSLTTLSEIISTTA